MTDILQEAVRRGLVASIGQSTLWRWLSGSWLNQIKVYFSIVQRNREEGGQCAEKHVAETL